MSIQININTQITSEHDAQALLSLYPGLTAMHQQNPNHIIGSMIDAVEVALQQYMPEDWACIKSELSQISNRAMEVAQASDFSDFKIQE